MRATTLKSDRSGSTIVCKKTTIVPLFGMGFPARQCLILGRSSWIGASQAPLAAAPLLLHHIASRLGMAQLEQLAPLKRGTKPPEQVAPSQLHMPLAPLP